MDMLRFDERQLTAELEQLPKRLRVIFATACAERLMPAYVRYSEIGLGNLTRLTSILEYLWDDLKHEKMSPREVRSLIAECMRLIPDERNSRWAEEQAAAEDAVAALAYALRCRESGEAKEAAWAARRVYEALDNLVTSSDAIDPNEPDAEDEILSHPLVQAELKRQYRDIEQLRAARAEDSFAQVEQLRQRAKEEAVGIPQLR